MLSSDAVCEAASLGFGEGLEVLLARQLDTLTPGQILEIRSTDPAVEHDLRAWARFAAHEWKGLQTENGMVRCFIQRGTAQRIITSFTDDRETTGTRQLVFDAATRVPVSANPETGFSPRGAVVEKGSPRFSFDVLNAEEAWDPDSGSFYEQASAAQWNGMTDIPWSALERADPEVERSICQLMTFLAENEFAALYVPAKWIPRIHPHFAETVMFLTTQIRDEARHIEVFIRRALSGGAGLQFSSASTQRSLKTLLDREDFLEASFLLSVLGEGTFLDLLKFIEAHAPDTVTAEVARRTRIDEARHVHFALTHMKHAMESNSTLKNRLAAAARERASALSEVRGVNPLVEESLVVLAAGGLEATALPNGIKALRQLYAAMHENRIKRLQMIGFSLPDAESLSQSHTPNFM